MMVGRSRSVTPPELTGDSHTDWVLWELSLTLSEIAQSSEGEVSEPGGDDGPPHPCDGVTEDSLRSAEVGS